jgi:5-methylthioribose kinase
VSALLDTATVVERLRARGVLAPDEEASVEELAGGVSSVALLVRGERRAVVVKQALERLRVRADWRSDPRRTLVEAAALRALGELTPAAVPAVVDVDDELPALTMEALGAGFRCWKPLLLAGRVDPGVGGRLGEVLARWHAASAADARLRAPFEDREVFMELRVRPFFGAVAERSPELAAAVEETAERMLSARRCLVHGDFSPKNVLVAGERVVVLDCEVAHVGDPAFDLAFMVHHLALKAVARPAAAPALERCAGRFLAAYGTGGLEVDQRELTRQTACLMLARVDGKSPVDYLDGDGQTRVRALACATLTGGGASTPAGLWALVRDHGGTGS